MDTSLFFDAASYIPKIFTFLQRLPTMSTLQEVSTQDWSTLKLAICQGFHNWTLTQNALACAVLVVFIVCVISAVNDPDLQPLPTSTLAGLAEHLYGRYTRLVYTLFFLWIASFFPSNPLGDFVVYCIAHWGRMAEYTVRSLISGYRWLGGIFWFIALLDTPEEGALEYAGAYGTADLSKTSWEVGLPTYVIGRESMSKINVENMELGEIFAKRHPELTRGYPDQIRAQLGMAY